jgi:hypothetical protein
MAMLSGLFPFRGKIYADGAIRVENPKPQSSGLSIRSTVKIVKRADAVKGFLVLPKRWLSSGRSRG